jgi:PTH2 family peptidyl-tRNA hydrolase
MTGQLQDIRGLLVPLVSASAGFLAAYIWLTNRSTGLNSSSTSHPASTKSAPTTTSPASEISHGDNSSDYSDDSDEEITEEYATRLKNAKPPSSREECKLVLVVNQELSMTKGKIAAQCG